MNIYDGNMAAIRSQFPEVYQWLGEEGEDPRIALIETSSGLPNLCFREASGEKSLFYNLDNPLSEEKKRLEGLEFSPHKITFLIGTGLGYGIEVIRKRIQVGHKILVFEAHSTVLKKTLARVDLTELLRDGTLILSLPGEENVRARIFENASITIANIVILTGTPRCLEVDRSYRDLNEMVFRNANDVFLMVNTTLQHGPTMAMNEVANLPQFLFAPGIAHLFNRFAQIPCFVISAGPSLEEDIPHLKRAKGKGLLLATAPVVRLLLAHDIQPDFMISIDIREGNRVHFEGLWEGHGIPLLHPLRLASNIVRDFQGVRYVFQEDGGWLARNWSNKGGGASGLSASVSGWALKAAIDFGCNPIILVGQDLVFSDKTHVPGSARSRRINSRDPTEEFLWAKGLKGEKVLTSKRFVAFLNEIENMIRPQERLFINSSSRGLRIRGTAEITIEECIETHCQTPIDIGKRVPRIQPEKEVDFKGLVHDLRAELEEVQRFQTLCRRMLKRNDRVEELFQAGRLDDPEINSLVQEVEEGKRRMERYFDSFPLLPFFLVKEIHEIHRPEYQVRPEWPKRDHLEAFLKKNRVILPAVMEALRELASRLHPLLGFFQEIHSGLDRLDKSPRAGKAFYDLGKALRSMGLHRQAADRYQKALEHGEQSFEIYGDRAHSFFRLGLLREARESLQEARKRGLPEDRFLREAAGFEAALTGWLDKARAYHGEGDWVNALLYARKVLGQDPRSTEARVIGEEAEKQRDEKVREMKASQEKQRLERLGPSGFFHAGSVHMQMKEYREAILCFQKYLAMVPGSHEALGKIGTCYLAQGLLDRARGKYSEALRISPEYAPARLGLEKIRGLPRKKASVQGGEGSE